MPSRTFEDLVVWQRAHEMVLATYRLTDSFPRTELFGLTSQLRRAAVSVPANIAEGFRRIVTADKLRFYNIAQSSLEECRYYFILAQDMNYADTSVLAVDAEEVRGLLAGYMASLQNVRPK